MTLLTLGVKRYLIPSVEPFRVSPLIRKMVRTRYGRVEVMYTALKENGQHVDYGCLNNDNRITPANLSDLIWPSDLASSLNAPDAANIEQSPRSYESQNYPPLQTSRLINSCWSVQSFSVPEVVSSGASWALLHISLNGSIKFMISRMENKCQQTRNGNVLPRAIKANGSSTSSPTCLVSIEWTLAPGQRILKGVEEIPHDPGHNGVVVHPDQKRYKHGGNTWNRLKRKESQQYIVRVTLATILTHHGKSVQSSGAAGKKSIPYQVNILASLSFMANLKT